MSSLGIGSLVGALLLAFYGRRPAPLAMVGATLLFGVLEILLGVAAGVGFPTIVAMILLGGAGCAMSIATALANTTVQTNSPDYLRGRVMSIYLTVFAGSTPIGAALADFTSETWGAPLAVLFGGAVVTIVALIIGGIVIALRPNQTEAPSR